MQKRYIGLMSGTSLDGVDVALCKIDNEACFLEATHFVSFSTTLKHAIMNIIQNQINIREVGELEHKLALFFAKAVNELLTQTSLSSVDISAIGVHGQTVWHEPIGEHPFSLQLGNASVLAIETDIDVVSDFRSKDIALRGQGAPLAPAFHSFLFSSLSNCAVLNIGGMANISVLEPELIGYDTGCGNVLMDMWTEEHLNKSYDCDGEWAKSGKVHEELLENMLADNYFILKFPKSTGREYFNKKFLINYLEAFDKICAEDVQATLLALTVKTIVNEIKHFKIKQLLVCGGGVRNIFLMETLQKSLASIEVTSTEKYGVDADNMEAMIFAWLAYKRVEKETVNLKTVTGAKNTTVLGAIYAKN